MATLYASAAQALAHAGTPPADPARHLLNRFTFGPTAAGLAALAAQGPDQWWAAQLLAAPGYGGNGQVAATGPLLARSPQQVRDYLRAQGDEFDWDAMDQLMLVTLGLQAWSSSQLYEAVVDFLTNCVHVANHNGDVWNTRHTMDRDVIRAHAFGTYSDLLVASARNPAMMIYLSNADSDKSAINENYGRELLELHTVGLNYSEDDVKNSARIMTGRTVADYSRDYAYEPARHWTGPVTVLGFQHANPTAAGGEAVGDEYVRYLARHPRTAEFFALRLCTRFVSDEPSADLVQKIADIYLANDTAIVPALTAIVRSDEFWASGGAKVRRPAENLLATIRLLGITPKSDYSAAASTLSWMSDSMGDRPLDWRPPNGYPDVARAWRSSATLLALWAFHRGFVQGWYDDFTTVSTSTLYGGSAPGTTGAAVDAVTRALGGRTWTGTKRQALLSYLGEPESTPLDQSRLRWLLPEFAPLVLDSPDHALR